MQHDLAPRPPMDAPTTLRQNLSAQAAHDLILATLRPFNSSDGEMIPLGEALGRYTTREVLSPLDLPPFDNSAMDGYALLSADVECATGENPVALLCTSTLAAARLDEKARSMHVEPGRCVRIMTGAPIPPGADAVEMREEVDEKNPERIIFSAPVRQAKNIRRRGEDIRHGEVAIQTGTRLRASEIALLAACGQAQVLVARRPRVAIIATGDELREPGQELREGEIYNSNAFALRALCEECGALVVRREHAGDDPHDVARVMAQAARECDVLLTSGGVSAGDFDPVRDVLLGRVPLEEAQVQARFWKAAIKPGKPILFATMSFENQSAAHQTAVFGLPGNPVSVAVTFELFVRPALLALQGARDASRRQVQARILDAGRSPQGKAEFVRALVEPAEKSNTWAARVTGLQSSGRLTTMARANALIEIPADVSEFAPGDEFTARLLD